MRKAGWTVLITIFLRSMEEYSQELKGKKINKRSWGGPTNQISGEEEEVRGNKSTFRTSASYELPPGVGSLPASQPASQHRGAL